MVSAEYLKKITEDLKKPETKEQLNKIVEEMGKRYETKDLIMRVITSNTDYMNWLDNFTLKHPKCSNKNFPSEDISDNDKELLKNLRLIYDAISNYADKNKISYYTREHGEMFYKVKIENAGFEIGEFWGGGDYCFCNRVLVDNVDEFIDFNDIINNEILISNKEKLKELSNLVISLHKRGVSDDVIKIVLEDTLKGINYQKELYESQKAKTKVKIKRKA